MENVILLLIHLCPVFTLGKLYISTNETSSPGKLCRLATPRIDLSKERNIVEVNTDDLDIAEGQALWIGYRQYYQTFFYKGCSLLGDVMASKQYNIRSDPGQCFSFCQRNTNLIGLMDRTCFCVDTITATGNKFKHVGCNLTCINQDGALCGGVDVVSIYETGKNLNTSAANGTEKVCLAVNPSPRKYVWSVCNTTYGYMCAEDNGTLNTTGDFKAWGGVMQDCLSDKRLPVEAYHPHTPNMSGSELWTGHLRSYSIMKGDGGRQGYVQKQGGRLYLGFERIIVPKKALCVDGTSENSGQNAASSKVAVSVSVPVIVICIAVAFAVFFIVKMRKRRAKNAEQDSDYIDPAIQPKPSKRNAKMNPSFESECVPANETLANDYTELEPDLAYATVDDTEEDQDGEYDTTARTPANRPINESSNEYNTFKDVLDDPYNHCQQTKQRADETYNHCQQTTYRADETYSHTLDNGLDTYGKTNKNGRENNLTRDSNDTYNHITTYGPKAVNDESAEKTETRPFNVLSGQTNYEFALEPSPTTRDYELAKPPLV